MSNMFLHFPQVIDSKLKKQGQAAVNLWNSRMISLIRFLNKQADFEVRSEIEADGKFAPLPSSIPQAGLCFLNLIN